MSKPGTFEDLPAQSAPTTRLGYWRMVRSAVGSVDRVLVIGVAVTMLFGFWHLDRYPRTWFDEGSYLEVSRNLTESGAYAAVSADGTHDYAPVIGVGPTLLLPVAGALHLEGIELGAARLVPATYLLIATLLLYLVSRALFGQLAAAVTLLVVFTLPSLGWVETGRQVLGEAPAFAFLLAGGVMALRARSWPGIAGAGVLLGLAMVTKGQYLMILPATIAGVALVDWLDVRARSLRWYAALLASTMATYALWILALLMVIGDGDVWANVTLLRESSSGALIVFDVDRMIAACKLLLGPGSFFLVAPASVASVVAWRRASGERRLAILSLCAFHVVWLGWFATASIAWPRYAFPGIAVSTIFMGYMISWLVTHVRAQVSTGQGLATARIVASGVFLSAVLLLVVAGAWRELRPVLTEDQREPQRFAERVDNVVPADTAIDGWEPEINFLSSRDLVYPPLGSLDTVVRATWYGQTSTESVVASLRSDYLIVGPFGRWVGVYDVALDSGAYTPTESIGAYQLYRRND